MDNLWITQQKLWITPPILPILHLIYVFKVKDLTNNYIYAPLRACLRPGQACAPLFKMTCLNPKPAKANYVYKLNEETGEIIKTKKLRFIPVCNQDEHTPDKDNVIMIPCGKCAGCQIEKANEWATRAYLESQKWAKNAFLTITYNNDNLPAKRTLIKADLQKFWKRLRKTLKEPIRYMACGEYGPKTLRPHYHAAVFNYWPDDCEKYKQNITGNWLYTSKKLNNIWGKGYVIIGELNYESAAYIARYVYKKAFGLNKDWNTKHGRTPEFTLASRRPGIAGNILNDKVWQVIKRNMGVFVKTRNGTKLKKIPQFLKKKWRETEGTEEYYKKSDARARELKKAHARETSDNYYQALKKQYESQELRLKRLDKRGNTE